MKRFFVIPLLILQILFSTGCTNTQQSQKTDKLQVYTSFYAMYDFAKQIGGDKADVYIMCQPGQEAHDFEPTAQDMAKLSKADVFIYNGMGMEHWADSVIATLPSSVSVVEASKSVKHHTSDNDPHVWLNPDNAYAQIVAIADAFIEKDSSNAQYYTDNLKSVKEKITQLNQTLRTSNDSFTKDSIIVSHEAYAHLCDILDIKQISVNGKDHSDEPTPQRIAEVESFITNNDIKYIFTSYGTNDVMNTIASDTNSQIAVLDPFEGSPDNKDYFEVMNENIAQLIKALS